MASENEENQAVLNKLGFTIAQSKIYLAFSKLGSSTAKEAAKTAQLDRGEAYRLISALEEKGFLQRILVSPLKFKAIPIEDLLPILIQNKKDEISLIEKETNQLIQRNATKKDRLEREEGYFRLVPQAGKALEEIRRDHQSLKRNFDSFCPLKVLQTGGEAPGWEKALKKGVKVVEVINEQCKEKDIPNWIKQLARYPNFSLRHIPSACSSAFPTECVIVDNRKVWIRINNDENFRRSSYLVTNNAQIIALARSYFDRIFQDSTPIQLTKRS
jgi:hypothetical protein